MLPSLDGLTVCRMIRSESDADHHATGAAASGIASSLDRRRRLHRQTVQSGRVSGTVRAMLRRAPASRTVVDQLESGDLKLDLIARRATAASSFA